MGKILAICTSPRRGTLKTPVPSAVLTPEWGIVGDAHGGSWHRQVSLLSAEKIEAFRQKLWVDYGAFGENLVVGRVRSCHPAGAQLFAIWGCRAGNDPDRQGVPQRLRHPPADRRLHHAAGGRVRTGGKRRHHPHRRRDEAAAHPADLPCARGDHPSDKGSRGEREDKSGPLIVEMLTATGYKVRKRCFCRTMPPSSKPSCCALRMPVR